MPISRFVSSLASPAVGRRAAVAGGARWGAAVLAGLLLCAPALSAQQGPRPLTLDDYGPWARIGGVALSADGGWMGWVESPNDGDSRLFVRSTTGEGEFKATNGQAITFSDDGRRVAFLTTPPEDDRPSGQNRGPTVRTLHWIDLESGTESTAEGVRGFAFGGEGRYLAVHRDPADREAEHDGSDLLLHDLSAGSVVSLGNVSAFAFNESGSQLAWLVDAAERAGNGLYLMETAAGRLRALNTRAADFDDLVWNEAGDALVALRGTTPEGMTQRENTLLLATGIGSGTPAVREWSPQGEASVTAGLVLSELGPTRWITDDLIALGLKEQEPEFEDDRPADEKPDVDVWHWNDDRLQSQQMVQAAGDRRSTHAAVYDVRADRFVPLGTPEMRRVDLTDNGRWAIGRNDSAYRGDVTVAGGQADLVRLDPRTGERAPIASGVRRAMGSSPDGRFYLYALDERVYLVDLESLETTDLTEATGIDFIDREFDVIAERPAHGLAGWTENSEEVLLYTRFDLIAVPTDGGDAIDLTGGMGEREQIRFRVQSLDPDREWVDLDDTLLSAYGERTKQSGWFALDAGSDPRPLLHGDEMLGGLRKAADSDRVIFTRQTFEQFPDLWVADLDFASPRRMSDANPQISEFAWGRRVLVDYTDDRGHELQATLALPANHVEGERYPMVVYFYEKMSQRHHQFSQPVYDDRPHISTYASNGYLVLMPDIVYEPGRPGSSALDDVVSATRAVIDLGYADPDRIGLQGHSWGGYESSFIVTQTDMFAAVVTGAPLTNLMSMYNINYKSSGSGNGPILEWSQGRLGTTPWDDFDLFVSQSPIHHAQNIDTPFLILHGTEDGAVDWNQGLEFYNAARRLEKEVILLSYPGEPHHLAREANQKDFQRRMMEYFDHHLRGVEAPEWIRNGVPFLRKGQDRARVIS